jgi:hypothetical protein
MLSSLRFALLSGLFAAACAAPSEETAVSHEAIDARTPLRLNQISVKGTHNSYHVARLLSGPSTRYTHAPLEEQLDAQGVRSFELDLHVEDDLRLRVFHTDHDRETRCATLAECLGDIKGWSDRHPNHVPIFVMLEEKDIGADAAAYYDALDREVLAVWPRERLVTPSLVRGAAPSLREGVAQQGWPTLDDSRGKILLFLTAMNDERKEAYRKADRVAFATGWLDEPDVGVLVIDEPEKDGAVLVDAVRRGYLVRSRGDAGMKEVRDGDLGRFRAALGAGAHVISTDQPVPGRILHRDYEIDMPVARCNAIVGPSWCNCLADFDVESMR